MNAKLTGAEEEKRIRYMIKKRITGIIMAVVMFALWLVRGWPLRIGFVAVMVMSTWEMYGAFIARGTRPIRWIGIAYAISVVPCYMAFGAQALFPLMAVCCMLGLAGVIIRGEIDFDALVATLFPLFYPAMLCTLVFPLFDIAPTILMTEVMGLIFLIPLMNDLFAYEVGSKLGKHLMAPVLSPKKSWEGAVGGLVASVVFAVLVPVCGDLIVTYIPYFQQFAAPVPPLWMFALCGLVGGAAAQIGDLTASMVKRYCGIKDYGAIFPGHGGMLDRMDSVLFACVVVYVFFVVLWH